MTYHSFQHSTKQLSAGLYYSSVLIHWGYHSFALNINVLFADVIEIPQSCTKHWLTLFVGLQQLHKESECHEPLKTRLISEGEQLLHICASDSKFRERLKDLDQHWMDLKCELPNKEADVHETQKALFSKDHVLPELLTWLEGAEEQVIGSNHSRNSASDELKKYRVRYTVKPLV